MINQKSRENKLYIGASKNLREFSYINLFHPSNFIFYIIFRYSQINKLIKITTEPFIQTPISREYILNLNDGFERTFRVEFDNTLAVEFP